MKKTFVVLIILFSALNARSEVLNGQFKGTFTILKEKEKDESGEFLCQLKMTVEWTQTLFIFGLTSLSGEDVPVCDLFESLMFKSVGKDLYVAKADGNIDPIYGKVGLLKNDKSIEIAFSGESKKDTLKLSLARIAPSGIDMKLHIEPAAPLLTGYKVIGSALFNK